MTLQALAAPIIYPGVTVGLTSLPGLAAGDTLDGSGEYTAVVICAPQDMTISHVGFKCQAVSGSPTATVSIQTVDAATGAPTGTLWATNTSVTTATLTTTFALHALTAAASITKGQVFAVVVTYASGTSFNVSTNAVAVGINTLPYRVTNVTGSAVKTATGGMNIALGSSTTSFYPILGLHPAASIAANAFNNTSSAKRGVRFQVPFKCVVPGFRYLPQTAVGDFTAQIEDDSGNILSSSDTAFEGDQFSAVNGGIANMFFDSPVTLNPATWYRLALVPASSTNINMPTATLPGADYAKAWLGGANFYYSTAASGTWTDQTTQVPYLDLLISQLDDGAGSGGARNIIGL